MSKSLTPTQKLLKWCQHVTKEYKNVDIQNFSKSWSNGLAFNAIIHHFRPDLVDYSSLSPAEAEKNVTLAFGIYEKLGITMYSLVEDLMLPTPEPKSLQMQVYEIYQYFSAQQKQDEERKLNELVSPISPPDDKPKEIAPKVEEPKPTVEAPKVEKPVQKVEPVVETPKVVTPKVETKPTANSEWLADLFAWRNPVINAVLLVTVWMVIILVKFYGFTFLTLVGRILQLTVLAGFVAFILGKFKILILSASVLNMKFATRADVLQPLTDSVVQSIQFVLPYVLIQNPIRSLRFFVAVQIICMIGKWMSGVTLIALAIHVGLLYPLVMKHFGVQINAQVSEIEKKVKPIWQDVISKIPPAIRPIVE